VLYDILGISAGRIPKFSKNYLADTADIAAAVRQYVDDVKQQRFPAAEHSFE
ncbi:MAG: 3-methyl-2-oxobutanoate hydroxymethyltransferase, partial [Gammaproteobacteria bacterium]|nr:3-methyl-2-oxobutanoate hydroxymethyltransferase [Gammaproteobacteria bacterium]